MGHITKVDERTVLLGMYRIPVKMYTVSGVWVSFKVVLKLVRKLLLSVKRTVVIDSVIYW